MPEFVLSVTFEQHDMHAQNEKDRVAKEINQLKDEKWRRATEEWGEEQPRGAQDFFAKLSPGEASQ